jgi:kanamycin kinase
MSNALSAIPTAPVAVPAAVTRLAGADEITPAWLNELGGLTFRLAGTHGDRFVKWVPAAVAGLDLDAEVERLAWAATRTPVPRVLEAGSDDDGRWLVTAALPGRSAVDPHWIARPQAAARAVGAGLRALHDTLVVDECPFTWPLAAQAARLPAEELARLGGVPPVDRLVVCHGDACAPNTLLDDEGRWTAHVDLGALGVADRWADLAVACLSLGWNYGPGHEATFFAAYGIEPDPRRIAFYQTMWDLD